MGIFDKFLKRKEKYNSPADKARAHYQRGEKAFQEEKYRRAEKELKKTIELNPDFNEAYGLLEATYLQIAMEKSGKIDEIISLLKECVSLNPNTVAHGLLGRIYDLQGKLDEANQEYKEHLRIHPRWEDTQGEIKGTPVRGLKAVALDEMARIMFLARIPENIYVTFRSWLEIRKSIGVEK